MNVQGLECWNGSRGSSVTLVYISTFRLLYPWSSQSFKNILGFEGRVKLDSTKLQ